ncbi:MAG: response regulator [Cyanobacteria bacterium P01_G01_bin.54]
MKSQFPLPLLPHGASWLWRWLGLFGLMAASLLGNVCNLSVLFGIDFLFGSVFVLIVLRLYGLFWGTLAGLVAGSYTYWLWGHPYAMVIFTLEAAFIGWGLRSGWQQRNIIVLAEVYWLAIGIPLVGLFYGVVLALPWQWNVLLIASKQAVNGIFNATVAVFILDYLPLPWRSRQTFVWQQLLLNLLVMFVLMPVLIVTVINGNQAKRSTETEIKLLLQTVALPLQNNFDQWFERHEAALATLAQQASQASPTRLGESLEQTKARLNDVLELQIVDEQGQSLVQVVDERPATEPHPEPVPLLEHQQPIPTQTKIEPRLKPVESPVLVWEVPLSTPAPKRGKVYALVDLRPIHQTLLANQQVEGLRTVIVDAEDHAILSSSAEIETPLDLQQDGEIRQLSDNAFQWLPYVPENTPQLLRWRHSFYGMKLPLANTRLAWSLLVQISPNHYIDALELTYVKSLSLMLAIALVTRLIALRLSQQLGRPLQELTQVTTNLPEQVAQNEGAIALPHSRSQEIIRLGANFQLMAAALRRKFAELQEAKASLEVRVQERTQDLRIANQQLEQQIYEREQIQALLREREERYALAISGTNDGIWDWDLETNQVYYSPTWLRIVGYPSEESGENELAFWFDRLHPDELTRVMGQIQAHLQGATRIYRDTYRLQHQNGTYLWIEAKGRCLRSEPNKAYRFVGTITDITERQRVAAELRQAKETAEVANRAKSDFLATMSHEIRTPMNAIIGMTEFLTDTALDAQQQEFVDVVRTSSNALLTLINDILDFSKIEAGKIELDTQIFELYTCVEAALDLMVGTAKQKGLELAYLIDPHLPQQLLGDVTRLRQILTNLLNNAVKFTAEGEVVIVVYPEAQLEPSQDEQALTLHFEVRDTGIGIPEERHDRLFKPFSQVDTSTTRQYGGTGLGLAICDRLVRLMGGRIWVETAINVGSIFHFTIVVQPATLSEPVSPADPPPQLLHQKRVLIVDDNATNRHLLLLQTQAWGMTPTLTASGQQALDLLRSGEAFEVAILDRHMPQMDGIMLAQHIQQLRLAQPLPLLLLTSLGQHPAPALAGLTHHFAATLSKPIKQAALRNALLRVFSSPTTTAPLPSATVSGSSEAPASLCILLAEDNAVNQKVALNMLKKLNYRADVVANGLEAITALKQQDYDVILMDVQMPEMDGLTAAQKISQQWGERRPYIVALTANVMQGDRERCLAAGMDDYLSKPVRLESLAAALQRWSNHHHWSSPSSSNMPSPSSILDPMVLEELRVIGGETADELLRDLFDAYLQDGIELMEQLQAAIANQDPKQLQHTAHTLKSSSASLGANEFAKLCQTLETLGRQGRTDVDAESLPELQRQFEQVKQAIQAERSKI